MSTNNQFAVSRVGQWIACWSAVFALLLIGCGDDSDPSGNVEVPVSEGSGSGDVSKSDELVTKAVESIKQRQFGDAVKLLNQAIESDESCAEAYFQRAGILADARQDENAFADYGKAIELQPDEVRYLNMRGLFLLTRSQLEEAAKDFAKAIEHDPKYVQAYNNLGLVKLAQNEFQSAIDDFNKAVELDATYVDGFNNRGFAWYQAGNDERALADFNQTLKLNPEYVNAFNNRGMLFARMKNYDKAIEDFSSAIRLDPRNAKHYRNRQAAYTELGQVEQARADGNRVKWLVKLHQLNSNIALHPQRAEYYIEKASHLADAGEREIALATFKQALTLKPDSIGALVARADFWLSIGELEKAIADCNSAIKSAKANSDWSHEAYSIRGDAYAKLKDYDKAIADYTTAKRLDSGVAEAYYYRAIQRRKKGDTAGFQADLAKVRQLDPSLLR